MDHLAAELIINHTSDEHSQFQQARRERSFAGVGPRIGGRQYIDY
jgi:glycosidase